MIIDASVAVKWILPEEFSEQAELLLSKHNNMYAPSIVNLEVVSAITKRYRMGALSRNLTYMALNEWEKHIKKESIILVKNSEIWEEAKELTLSIPHSFPDCLYLALAKYKQLPLVTADKVFIGKAKKYYNDIVNISNFLLH
ncbi:MAG: type II toxin-antitoxin system VapC family toxin [Rickettsiales bacterium]